MTDARFDIDEPCFAPGCRRWQSEHSPEQAKACAIAGLEQRIADLDRTCAAEKTALIESGPHWGEGELDGTDPDRLKDLAFEHHMELDLLRYQLDELRAAGPPAAEEEAQR